MDDLKIKEIMMQEAKLGGYAAKQPNLSTKAIVRRYTPSKAKVEDLHNLIPNLKALGDKTKNMTIHELAQYTNCLHKTIKKAMGELKMEYRSTTIASDKLYLVKENLEWCENKTIREIALKFRINENALRSLLYRHNIPHKKTKHHGR